MLGPHIHTPSPTARRWRTPTARPVDGQSGEGECLTSDAPHNGGRHPPGNALPPPPQRATPALKGASCGADAGSPRPHRPHPEHTGRGTPAARPGGRAVGGGTAPDTRRPSQRWQATPPPGDGPPPPPQHAAPTGRAGQGDSFGPPHPHTRAHSMWVTEPNSPPSGRAVGRGTAPDLRRFSQRWKAPPPGDALPPTPQRATPARKGARCGTGAGSPRPHRPHPEHTGRGSPAARPRGRAVGGGTAPDTRRPSQQWQATIPPRGRPPTTPAARSPHRACRPSQVGRNRDRTGPPPSAPDGARDRGRTCGGARTTWNGPTSAQCRDRARCARHTTQGGGSGRRVSASAHTRKGQAETTRRATGPSSQNAQTAWNGVPASEGKGHPDETARHKQRTTRGAGRGKRERHNTTYRPEPPEPAASAAHTPTGHCTRQGSNGALRHAPAPRQGSLRASPRGSHWRQASSTGPAAPAPRATTH